mmetsp:Transcript_3474/g.2480  ORF Transcript_3474/g.2480 Transcript_3474/m.2480 type:complete len:137 (+) Transcript_3474:191-601(+)|eukprot:CAMPEP_0202977796 /NCGR_PEP_ID=MMETSP1396-20130829/84463_1 /ASSEMBLY_ACC=CAM_ASM_000872 /TAXON_ID= /ORGANISM="Pseudokeronopsis sp., Strain Brazil" /LENGTH=136 /DNA_ID=CAMNT_0049716609 /DNA_START=189 /DNA_END=599 /DNA_ORIENTATION=-
MLVQDEWYESRVKGLNVNLIYIPGVTGEMQERFVEQATDPNSKDPLAVFNFFLEFTKSVPTFVPYIKEQKFDVFVRETYMSMNALAHMFGTPHNIAYLTSNVDASILHLVLSAPIHSTYESSFRSYVLPKYVGLDE